MKATKTARGFYKVRQPGSLKEAVAELVMACGGQGEAATLSRVSRSQIARYTDDSGDNEQLHMPVDIVALLELHCGEPIVTRYLAMHAGGLFVPLPRVGDAPYARQLAAIGRDTGKFYAEACGALETGAMDVARAGAVTHDALKLAGAIAALVGDLMKITSKRRAS